MTSVQKGTIAPNTSGLVNGQTAGAQTVTAPIIDLSTYVGDARQFLSVTAGDTHMKHLDDAVLVTGAIEKEILNSSGNAQLRFKVDKTLAQWNAEKLQGHIIGATPLTVGQGYVFDGTQLLGTDLRATQAQWNANKLQGRSISSNSPQDGDVPVWNSQANEWQYGAVEGSGGETQGRVDIVAQGRLTLSSTNALDQGDTTAATTLYYLPYTGSYLSLWDGKEWVERQIRSATDGNLQVSNLLADKNYDVFAAWTYDALLRTSKINLVATVWTNNTTRATPLLVKDGFYVINDEASQPTRRYLGTIRVVGDVTFEDSMRRRFVYNHYNRVKKKLRYAVTGTWTYNNSTLRPVNNDVTSRIEFVQGVNHELVYLQHTIKGAANVAVTAEIGLDSTNTGSADIATTGSGGNAGVATYEGTPAVGYHYLQSLESAAGTPAYGGSVSLGWIMV